MTRRAIKPGLRVTSGLRAALYLRQSLDMSGEEMAVARQEKANRDYCAAKGWEVVAVYRENDTSASGRKPRPKFAQMIADAKAGKFDVMVATFLDRLTRSVRDLLPLIELYREHGVATATVRDSIDLTTDVGELVATILAAVANLEIRRKGERQVLANQQRAENGDPHIGGARPVGYQRAEAGTASGQPKLVIHAAEAKVIRQAYKDVLAGRSCSAIARDFNAAGLRTTKLKTKRQGLFDNQAVKTLLCNPVYAGLKVYRGEVVRIANWKPVVDEATWRSAKALLTDPLRRTNPHPGGTRRWLGSGIYRCGVCAAQGAEERMVVNYRDDGARVYLCGKGKHLTRVAPQIDERVVDVLCARLARADAVELLEDRDRPDLDALRDRATDLRHQLDEAAADRVKKTITQSQLRIITAGLTAELAEVDEAMIRTDRAELLAELIHAEDPRPVWDGYDLDRQRGILRKVLDVVVLRGRAGGNSRSGPRPLDLSTVDIQWRA